MEHGKKILCLLLSILMVFGLLPAAAMAANTLTEPDDYSASQFNGSYILKKNLTSIESSLTFDSENDLVIQLGANITAYTQVKLNNSQKSINSTFDGQSHSLTRVVASEDSRTAFKSTLLSMGAPANSTNVAVVVKDVTLKANGNFYCNAGTHDYKDFNPTVAALLQVYNTGSNTLENVSFVNSYNYGIYWTGAVINVKGNLSFSNTKSTGCTHSKYYDIGVGKKPSAVLFNFTTDSSVSGSESNNKVSIGFGMDNYKPTEPWKFATGAAIDSTWAGKFVSEGYNVLYAGGALWLVPVSYTSSATYSITKPTITHAAWDGTTTGLKFGDTVTLTATPETGYKFDTTASLATLNSNLKSLGLSAAWDGEKLKITGNVADSNIDLSKITGWPAPAADSKTINLGTLPEGMELGDGSGDLKQTIADWNNFKPIILKPKEGYILKEDSEGTLTALASLTSLVEPLNVNQVAEENGDGSFKISTPYDPYTPLQDITTDISEAKLADEVEAVITDNNGTVTVKCAKLADAIDRTDVGTVVMKKNPATAVSNATLSNGVTLEDTSGNTYKATGDNATVDVDTDGKVTLKGGTLEVTPAAGKTAEVKVTENNDVPYTGEYYTVSGDTKFIVTAGTGSTKATVTIPTTGKSVTSGNLTFTAGADGSVFPLDGSDLTGAGSNPGDAVTVPKGTSAEIKVGEVTGAAAAAISVTVPDTNTNGNVTVTKGNGTDAMATVTVAKAGDKFTVDGKTYTAGADNSTFTIGADGKVKLTSGSVKLADGESMTGTFSGKTIENPANSGSDSVTVEGVPAAGGEAAYDKVTVPKGGSGSVYIKNDDFYFNTSETEDLVLKVTADGVSVLEGTITKKLDEGRDIVGTTSGATIANPDPSGGDTITVTSDKDKDRVTVPAGTDKSVTITKAGETTGETYFNGAQAVASLVIDVTAAGASLSTGNVALRENQGIGVYGNTITYTNSNDSEEPLTVRIYEYEGNISNALIDLEEGRSFTDKDGNTYTAKNGKAEFAVDKNTGEIRLASGSAEVTPAAGKGARIEVAKKSSASVDDDFCPATGGSPFIVTAGKGNGTGTGEGNDKATVTILTRGETASSNYLTFTAGTANSTFPLDGSELTNDGDSIAVAGAEGSDITVKVGTTTGEPPTNIEVTIPGDNGGKTTVTKGQPTIVKIGKDGDKFKVNDTEYPADGNAKKDEEYVIDTDGTVTKIEAKVFDDNGTMVGCGGLASMLNNPPYNAKTIEMVIAPASDVTNKTLNNGVTLKDLSGNQYKANGEGTKISVDTTGKVSLTEGKLDVTPAATKTASVEVAKNASASAPDGFYSVSGSDKFTVTAGKGDGSGEGAGNDKPTVTIPSTGKTVTVGASADAGMVFTAGQDGSTFPLDGSKLNNTGDSVKFGKDRTGTAQVDAGNGQKINISENTATTVKKVSGGHTVTLDTASTSFEHSYPVGEGSGSISYTAAENNTTFFVGDDGKTALISGAVKVPANGSTDVRPDGWNSSVSVSVPEGGSDVIVSTVSDTPAKGKADVANGKSVTIGDKTYKADAANTAFTFDETGKVTLYSGKAELDKGESILGGVSGVEIKNTSADEGKKVTVEKGADQDIVTVPADGKVTIGGVEYTNHSDSDAMTLKVDAEGKVTLTGGAVDLDKDEAVHLNGTAITNNKTGSTLTVSANGTTGTVSAKAGDSFSVGTGTVKDPSADMDFTINSDGTVSANLTNGQSVTINGVKYTGGEGGATLTLDQDGNLSISGNYSANIPGQNTHEINGRVTQDGSGVSGATVTLTQGGKEAVKLATVTTGADGSYKFPAVPAGTYNVVVVSGGKTMTKLVTVADGDVDMGELALPTAGVSSVVDVKPSSPAGAMVGGLDTVASNNAAVGSHVTITLEVDQADSDNEGIAALADGKTLMSMDFTVNKTTGGTTTPITNTGMVLEIILTFDTTNKTNITVYRQHGSDPAEALTKLDTRPTDPAEYEDGTYYVGNGFVVVYTEKFSSYAIGYDVVSHSGVPSAPVGSTAFIGGTKNGSISVSPKNARMGETVTITVNPDDGYKLDSLTVTDRNGNPLTLTKISDNQYTYVAPNGRVDVQATFAKADGGYAACDKGASCPMTAYTDVRPTAWYHDGVHYCLDNGLMNGYGNGIWGPSDTTTRAQIVTILWRMNGCPVVDYAMDFEDVASGAWYAEAIRWAASEGIVLGYGDNTFGPNDAVKREQLVTILHRYARFMGYDLSADAEITGAFADADHVSTYAIPAMRWACGCGLVSGVELSGALSLNPLGATSRAEMATLIMRFCAEIVR